MADGPDPLDKCEHDRLDAEGPTAAAYEGYSRWLDWWRESHPADERGDYDLLNEYVAWYRDRPDWPFREKDRS